MKKKTVVARRVQIMWSTANQSIVDRLGMSRSAAIEMALQAADQGARPPQKNAAQETLDRISAELNK